MKDVTVERECDREIGPDDERTCTFDGEVDGETDGWTLLWTCPECGYEYGEPYSLEDGYDDTRYQDSRFDS